MAQLLLSVYRGPLSIERHPLHPLVRALFERLSAQGLTAKELRDFLRLGQPLCCPTLRVETPSAPPSLPIVVKAHGGAVPLARVKCLVSMTTPRDTRLQQAGQATPAFVEFDIAREGCGALFLPSIAPQGPASANVVGVGLVSVLDNNVIGGIGAGESE